MAYLKPAEVRSMGKNDRLARLAELRRDLMNERGVAAMGGSPPSPGKIRQLRRQIARILTIQQEDKLGIKRGARPTAKGATPAKKPESEKPAAKKPAGPKTTPTDGKSGGHE